MWRARLALAGFFAGVLAAAAAPAELDLPKEIPDEPFDIRAGRLEYTNDTLYASGGVTGRFEQVEVRADRLSGNPGSGDLHLEGDIHFERGNIIWQGSELEYNYLTQTGSFGPSELDFDPVLMSVDHIERVSTNEYLLRGATFTTCRLDHPHYTIRAREARLVDDEYLMAKGVSVYVGKVPVFYWPYWRQRLSRSIFTFGAGYDSALGAYGLVKATVPLAGQVESITDINGYSKRGVGLGQGFAWEYPQAVGEFAAFYLRDEDPYARHDDAMARQQIGDDRYRFKLEHLQHFTDEHYINTKWNYLSDPFVLEEYFRREYRSSAQPENYASGVYGGQYLGSEAFINARLNDFYDNTDRVEYSADLYRMRLGNSPFYLQSENSVAYLERVYSDTNTVDAAYDSVRADSANTLYLPQRLGFLRLVPRAGYRATYYSKASGGGGEEIRQIPGVGMEAALQASRVLSERERWYGKGLRHRVEPYADYIYEDVRDVDTPLPQFDSIDALADENKVKLGLRNTLQTRRKGRVSLFADLDLYTYYRVDRNGEPDPFDPLFLDARMPLTERTLVDALGVVDWNGGHVPYFNTRISHDRDGVVFSLEHLYQETLRSLWTPRLELFPKARLSFETYGRYDDNNNELEEIAVGGFMTRCCMRYGLGYHLYDENEHTIMVSISLSAFPEVGMSSGF